jgi:hypothetical protein
MLLERGDVFEGNRTLIEDAGRSWRTASADWIQVIGGNSGVDLLLVGARAAPVRWEGGWPGDGTVVWRGAICAATRSGAGALPLAV